MDHSPEDSFRSLTPVERVLCGALILRQLHYNPKAASELEKYGPEGSIKLCSARAIGTFTVLLGVVGVALAIAHVNIGAILAFVLVWLTGALTVGRSISAGRAGRRWRSVGPG
jgi:hypothetical protein